MSTAVLARPDRQVRTIIAEPITYRVLEPAGDSTPLLLGYWHGLFRWTGAVLGPEGFLASDFEVGSASAIQKSLRGLIERRLGVCRSASQDRPPTESARQFDVLHFALETLALGHREEFDDIPLDYSLGTPFQQQVWRELRKIRWGETVSYGELAARIGNPKASRAVGSANGANVLAPIVPCHRVLAGGNRLGGYGGGLPLKRRLLQLEGVEVDA